MDMYHKVLAVKGVIMDDALAVSSCCRNAQLAAVASATHAVCCVSRCTLCH
jgi:hypothetical protein